MNSFSEVLLSEVRIRGYRSLWDSRVTLGPLTVLVGPNGSGKSSFVDALTFLGDALTTSPADALKTRGGIKDVLTRGARQADEISIEVAFQSRTPGRFVGQYRVVFRLASDGDFTIPREICALMTESGQQSHNYEVNDGRWVNRVAGVEFKLAHNRLALPLLSGIEQFAPVYEALTHIYCYDINDQAMRAPHEGDDGDHLAADGSNAASVLQRLRERDKALYQAVKETLARIVPGIKEVTTRRRGRQLALAFEEAFSGGTSAAFEASSISEGTLRALAVLLAIYQLQAPTLVMLEEPEASIHPGAAAILADALSEASLRTQILVTTHSPDLITRFDVDALRAVDRTNGITVIAQLAEQQRQAVRERLFTSGELLRIEGLRPGSAAGGAAPTHA